MLPAPLLASYITVNTWACQVAQYCKLECSPDGIEAAGSPEDPETLQPVNIYPVRADGSVRLIDVSNEDNINVGLVVVVPSNKFAYVTVLPVLDTVWAADASKPSPALYLRENVWVLPEDTLLILNTGESNQFAPLILYSNSNGVP